MKTPKSEDARSAADAMLVEALLRDPERPTVPSMPTLIAHGSDYPSLSEVFHEMAGMATAVEAIALVIDQLEQLPARAQAVTIAHFGHGRSLEESARLAGLRTSEAAREHIRHAQAVVRDWYESLDADVRALVAQVLDDSTGTIYDRNTREDDRGGDVTEAVFRFLKTAS